MKQRGSKKRPPLLIREQFEGLFRGLTDTERGKILLALMEYQWHEVEPDKLSDKLLGVFQVFKSFSDDDIKKYNEKCEQNRRNIKEYWDERRKQDEE